jgi:O-antigen ligase
MAYAPDSRSLAELFSELTRELTSLVRSEMALARAEMSDKISRAAGHLGTLALGAVLALAGVFTLAASLVLILVRWGVPAWGAALLVGLGLAAVGALLATRSLTALRREDLKPTQTIETLKETAAWKRQTN